MVSSRKNNLPWIQLSGAFILTLTVFGIACAKQDLPAGPIRAEVLTAVPKKQGEALGSDPTFELKDVEFNYLEDLESLSGKYYTVKSGGILEMQVQVEGTKVVSKQVVEKDVTTPRLHYTVKNGKVVPLDHPTLVTLSNTHSLDSLFSSTENLIGIHPDTLLQRRGKARLYMDSDSLMTVNGFPYERTSFNNALYIAPDFIFQTLKSDPSVKIAMGASIAPFHEFGHALFDFLVNDLEHKSVLDQVSPKARYLFSGIDEGFADFTAYTVTGCSNSLAGALEVEGTVAGQRDFTQVRFNISGLIPVRKEGIDFYEFDPFQCGHAHYCIGTLFSHSIFRTQMELGYNPYDAQDRIRGFQIVANAIKEFGNEVRKNGIKADQEALSDFFEILLNNIKDHQFKNSLKRNLRKNFTQKFIH